MADGENQEGRGILFSPKEEEGPQPTLSGENESSLGIEKAVDPETGESQGEVFDGNLSEELEEALANKDEAGEKAAAEIPSEEEPAVEAALEVGEGHRAMIKKKEYWQKMIVSVRAEKLEEDEAVNREKQAEKILTESLRILTEVFQEEIKSGNALPALSFYKKTILPAIKEDDPEINEGEYLDRLHAHLSQLEGIKDWAA